LDARNGPRDAAATALDVAMYSVRPTPSTAAASAAAKFGSDA
jgi:hypothetical protein